MNFFTVGAAIVGALLVISTGHVNCKNRGDGVVKAVLEKITRLDFPEANEFLRRIAITESNCGLADGTYRSGYHGGIWQVDEIGFADTQNTASHPGLTARIDTIKTVLGIDWMKVTWSDLREPLYSGLAARLYLIDIPGAIPMSLDDQANYWDQHYKTNPAASAEDFIILVKESGDKCPILCAPSRNALFSNVGE